MHGPRAILAVLALAGLACALTQAAEPRARLRPAPRLAQDLRFPGPSDEPPADAPSVRESLPVPATERPAIVATIEIQYEPLTADACEQLAADSAPLALLLADEHDAITALCRAIPPEERHRFCKVNSLRHALVALAAADARNKQAGEALRAYFELLGVEARRKLVEDSLAEVAAASAKFERLRATGVEAQPDPLERQRLELEERAIDAEVAINGLNARLQVLLGAEQDSAVRFWPATKVQSPALVADVEGEVALGLDANPQLTGLRVLQCSLGAETLPAVREALSQLQGLLGTRPTIVPLKKTALQKLFMRHVQDPADLEADLCVRRRQLDLYLEEREAETAARIRQAAAEMGARARQVELTRERARSWQQRIARLEAQAALTEASLTDLLSARLSLLQARNDLFQRVLDTHIALVKLREAQGCLGE